MPKSGLNVALKGLDDIFSTEESRQEEPPRQYMHNKENAVTMRLSAP